LGGVFIFSTRSVWGVWGGPGDDRLVKNQYEQRKLSQMAFIICCHAAYQYLGGYVPLSGRELPKNHKLWGIAALTF